MQLSRICARATVFTENPLNFDRVLKVLKLSADPWPSVYETRDESEHFQAACEHLASFMGPQDIGVVDLHHDAISFRVSPGNTSFCFTQQRHRELDLGSGEVEREGKVKELLRALDHKSNHGYTLYKLKVILDYVLDKCPSDQEWIAWKSSLEAAETANHSQWRKALLKVRQNS